MSFHWAGNSFGHFVTAHTTLSSPFTLIVAFLLCLLLLSIRCSFTSWGIVLFGFPWVMYRFLTWFFHIGSLVWSPLFFALFVFFVGFFGKYLRYVCWGLRRRWSIVIFFGFISILRWAFFENMFALLLGLTTYLSLYIFESYFYFFDIY